MRRVAAEVRRTVDGGQFKEELAVEGMDPFETVAADIDHAIGRRAVRIEPRAGVVCQFPITQTRRQQTHC